MNRKLKAILSAAVLSTALSSPVIAQDTQGSVRKERISGNGDDERIYACSVATKFAQVVFKADKDEGSNWTSIKLVEEFQTVYEDEVPIDAHLLFENMAATYCERGELTPRFFQ
jgi:hypothetical protein